MAEAYAAGRPALAVTWGQPQAVLYKQAWPVVVSKRDIVTYTLNWLGTGQPLTMTDTLPNGLGALGQISTNMWPHLIIGDTQEPERQK